MRIGIDARMYGPSTRGIGRYIQELIENLITLSPEHDFVIFLHTETAQDFTITAKNVETVVVPYKWYSIAEQILLPGILTKYNCDLYHFPHFNIPIFFNKPFVVTIHDLILMDHHQQRATTLGPLKYAVKKFFYKQVIKHAVYAAKHIIAISEYTRNRVEYYFPNTLDKTTVIYEGAQHVQSSEKLDTTAKIGYNIGSKPYILYVGSAYPHKNLKILTELAQIRNDIDILIIGKKDYFMKVLQQTNPPSHVKFLGFVPDHHLEVLYKHAHAYVFPSEYEGFGLPGLEAMQKGCPVISSNATCLPEILGEAALYFAPNDVQTLSEHVTSLLETNVRETYIMKGYNQARQYTWAKTAQETLDIYERTNS